MDYFFMAVKGLNSQSQTVSTHCRNGAGKLESLRLKLI